MMKYEKAHVELIYFGIVDFMTSSNTAAARDRAIAAGEAKALSVYPQGHSGQIQGTSTAVYNEAGGYWEVTVTVANPGGQHQHIYRYNDTTGDIEEIS